MDNELEHQKAALYNLIETWEANNINLAKQLIKKNIQLKEAVNGRYRGFFKLLGRKTIQSLVNIADKLQADKYLYRRQWYPDATNQAILAKIPLIELDLSGLRLKTLPEWVCSLHQLQQLRADHNSFDKLPESLCRLTRLKTLYVNHNKLSKLPLLIGHLRQLEILQFKNNQLSTLPNSLGKLQQLEQLDLQANKLNSLPQSIGGLSKLSKFDLSKNKLTNVPVSFGQLSNLTSLYLHNNRVLKIKRIFGDLSKLRVWYVDRKSFQNIPANLLNLELEELCIVSPSLDFPMNLITGRKNIKIYLHFLLDGHSKNIDLNQL